MKHAALCFLLTLGHAQVAAGNNLHCAESPERHVIHIAEDTWHTFTARDRSNFSSSIEAFGRHDFFLVLNNGWVLALKAHESGWVLRLLESELGGATDLSQVTPPFNAAVPNSRDLFGWHFRNSDNTGPNQGDVNAPQLLRLFQFSPELAGTAGFKPSSGAKGLEASGRGWLKILDYGLTNRGEGQRAAMNYLRFEMCLTWPKSLQEQRSEANHNSLDFTAAERESFGQCGLDLSMFTLNPVDTRPRILSGDIDGDDVIDQFVRVERISDGVRGIAVCRSGTWLTLFGFEPAADRFSSSNLAHIVSAFGAWTLEQPLELSYAQPPPKVTTEILVLERPEKGMAWLYWEEDAFYWRDVYSVVTEEP